MTPWLRCLTFTLVSAIAFLGSAKAEVFSGYEIAGACIKQGSAKPKDREDGTSVWFYDFESAPAPQQLVSRSLPCASESLASYLAFAERRAMARSGVSERELGWWDGAIENPVALTETKRCAILKNEGSENGLLILRTELEATRSEEVTGNQMLSLVQLDGQNNPVHLLSQFLSNESRYDIVRTVSVAHLCDADDDRIVDLVLKDARYAGYSYLLCSYGQRFETLSCERFDGVRGD